MGYVIGDPRTIAVAKPPEFDTDKEVNWLCPNCGENGIHMGRQYARYHPVCTNRECPVHTFSVFREGGDA